MSTNPNPMEPCLYQMAGACKNIAMLRIQMEGWRQRMFKRGVFRIYSVNTPPLCSDQQVKSLQTQVVGAVRPKQNVMQEVDGDVFGRVVTRP